METQDFLLEIGCEELPAKSLTFFSQTLANNIQNELQKAELKHGAIKTFATPRRLAVLVEKLTTQQPARNIERKGPAVSAAYDQQGKPTAASEGFARSCGVNVADLKVTKTDKGDFLFFHLQQEGSSAKKLLPAICKDALEKLPITKPMRWNSHAIKFIRPVHWILLLLGNESIETNLLNNISSNKTCGHHFMHPRAIAIKNPSEYARKLFEVGKVVPDFKQRQEMIYAQLLELNNNKQTVIQDEQLLQEVTGLVEWPVAMMGKFSEQFLEAPKEALILSMKTHQKYFSLQDSQGKLLPYFVTISNIESENPKRVIAGNERVMHARLSDASFFYHTDLQHSLHSRLEKLKTVVFQNKLGTLFDKSKRIALLANFIAKKLHADSASAERAGWLAKCDLLTEMVGEFPELQGIMGYYYALADKEPETVATAIKEQYLPRFAGDILPSSISGQAVAIADRIDTLIGIFGINQAPTGEKDPFGLRRAALGVMRTIIEKNLDLDLQELLIAAQKNYHVALPNSQTVNETFAFMLERLRMWYAEQNINADVFAAVLARQPTKPFDFHQRILAVQHFCKLPQAQALTAANKRVSNILKKEDGVSSHSKINPGLFQQPQEHTLADLLTLKSKEVEQLCQQGKYTEALTNLAGLQQSIDDFFDHVMVMVDDEKIRNNRLALLMNLRNLFLQIADISMLQNL